MAKKIDLVDYFKMYEKKWWEETNRGDITLDMVNEIGDVFGLCVVQFETCY